MHLAVVLHAEKVLMRTGVYPEHTFTLARNCSAALAASIAERLRTVLSASAPCTVMTTYAMTECVPICSNPRDGVQKLDSVGPPAGPEVNILLNDGVTLTAAPDVEGEVCVKGAYCTATRCGRATVRRFFSHSPPFSRSFCSSTFWHGSRALRRPVRAGESF